MFACCSKVIDLLKVIDNRQALDGLTQISGFGGTTEVSGTS